MNLTIANKYQGLYYAKCPNPNEEICRIVKLAYWPYWKEVATK